MYLPTQFEETRLDVLYQLIRARPLGMLVMLSSEGLNANHIPFEIDPAPSPLGTLRGHVARANPVWRDFSKEVQALVVFQGAQSYITPNFYPSKQETGKVVPTFNYIVVHAYGGLRVIDDRDWLRDFVSKLTDRHESTQPQPWKMQDAPDAFIETQLGAIVGLELPIANLLGKWKVSQNRTAVDQAGVVRGLREAGDANAVEMAQEIDQRKKT
ncbi:MAG: FMN-binding negative transcriptional regulator [Betaproteobacteria bacterium]